MQKQIICKKQYINQKQVQEITTYIDQINDDPYDSQGPKDFAANAIGWQGCWDKSLHLEKNNNPLHSLIARLKQDFGDFVIYESSLRHLCAPFLPHSDIRSADWLLDAKRNNFKEGFIFLIPLRWHHDYQPYTVFYSNPARFDEPLYAELQDILPPYATEYMDWSKNFSVRQLIKWESPGDLIAWENFQWHGSCGQYSGTYDRRRWLKEFLSIETWLV